MAVPEKPMSVLNSEQGIAMSRFHGPLAAADDILGSGVPRQINMLSIMGTPAIVESAGLHQLLHMVKKVAPTQNAVLILGESGSGKELIARSIHQFSPRSSKPWIDINCAALPAHLLESELFGYEKGAFSGAESAKQGMFELAHGGTLFLDEIGELEIGLQAKLLRILDGSPFFRLGGT